MSGPQCCENPPVLSSSCGILHEEEVGGLKCYVIGSPDFKSAVVLASDVFGYQAPKLRKLADKVAAFGFYVVVPDFFYGDPYIENLERPLLVYMIDHLPDKGFEDAKQVIEALKCKGISSIGAAGFCWGAKVVVELAKYAYVQATVLLHPSFVSWQDVQAVEVPISILGAEIDPISPPQLLKKFAEDLKAKPESVIFSFLDLLRSTENSTDSEKGLSTAPAACRSETRILPISCIPGSDTMLHSFG
ncbi:endo-1,3;1,4-beta-D-glucanase-like isoform X2 [Rhododendron vialii]|uniref:endo-1,3;1,4-beta-D-glucanase-like isoform X2 n=1 Tax=Rhododendron vialii TaxID=182163 RepID=UPI00265D778D|nr:endo-1,3;1,4-beta-D-glucanase-like isoform X2 [Rhododendron vialii]